MKSGGRGSKAKGANFEREVCVKLSLWITHGKKRDVFWRSAMSGGRATLGARRGHNLARQAGDICAVAPEGHVLTDQYYIECKFYRSLRLDLFLLGGGPLAAFWTRARTEAARYGRAPMLIAKQNGGVPLVLTYNNRLNDHPAQALVRVGEQYVSVFAFEDVFHVRIKRVRARRATP